MRRVAGMALAKIHLVEMVDPNYVVIAGVDKKYLPRR